MAGVIKFYASIKIIDSSVPVKQGIGRLTSPKLSQVKRNVGGSLGGYACSGFGPEQVQMLLLLLMLL